MPLHGRGRRASPSTCSDTSSDEVDVLVHRRAPRKAQQQQARAKRESHGGDKDGRRPVWFWAEFNAWWRRELEIGGKRASKPAILAWYNANATLWSEDVRPSFQETRLHAKCLRSTEAVREYFRRYRAARREHDNEDDDDDVPHSGGTATEGRSSQRSHGGCSVPHPHRRSETAEESPMDPVALILEHNRRIAAQQSARGQQPMMLSGGGGLQVVPMAGGPGAAPAPAPATCWTGSGSGLLGSAPLQLNLNLNVNPAACRGSAGSSGGAMDWAARPDFTASHLQQQQSAGRTCQGIGGATTISDETGDQSLLLAPPPHLRAIITTTGAGAAVAAKRPSERLSATGEVPVGHHWQSDGCGTDCSGYATGTDHEQDHDDDSDRWTPTFQSSRNTTPSWVAAVAAQQQQFQALSLPMWQQQPLALWTGGIPAAGSSPTLPWLHPQRLMVAQAQPLMAVSLASCEGSVTAGGVEMGGLAPPPLQAPKPEDMLHKMWGSGVSDGEEGDEEDMPEVFWDN